MIIDVTFVEVVDVLVRGGTDGSDNNAEHTDNNIDTSRSNAEAFADDIVQENQ
jgi:hypothetical protein